MKPVASPLARFVRAVHRRHLVLRVLERAGLGLLAGCAVAVVLVGVLLWHGQDAWGVAGIVLGVGALAGAFWGIANRLAPLAAAAEADRQFDLADLLATAWALRENAGDAGDARDADPFRDAVVAIAAARCRSLSPSAVLLRRLGARAWGGIALAVAFVATLAALSDRSPHAEAADSRPTPFALDAARRPILEIRADNADDSRPPRRVEQNPADDRPLGNDVPDAPPDPSPEALNESRAPHDRALAGSSSGTGGGEARSRTPDPSPQRPPGSPGARTPSNPSSPDGPPAAGAGRPAKGPLPAQVTGGGTLTGESPSRPDAPWARADWPTAIHSAREAVQSGRIPDDYRDLVRGYFDVSTHPPANTRPR